jgi:hypothetical protein
MQRVKTRNPLAYLPGIDIQNQKSTGILTWNSYSKPKSASILTRNSFSKPEIH